jgi:hypothetical protein
MLTYFPNYFSRRAILCYAITLALVSVLFINYVLPLKFVVFGFVAVILFFACSSKLTMEWGRSPVQNFQRSVFFVAFFIRLAYVIFIYYYYISETELPHAYYAGDELLYQDVAKRWFEDGYEEFSNYLHSYIDSSDSGYCWWLAILYLPFGPHVLVGRVVKCFIDAFTCLLLYNLGKRNFGESTGRIAAVFYMLVPNAWFYCGITLKEIEMSFLVVLFVERADLALHSSKLKLQNLILPLMASAAMLTFRTAMAAVMIASLVLAFIIGSQKQLQVWQKIVLGAVFAVWMFMTVGVELLEESAQLWANRASNQETGYQWRSETNSFAQYASAAVFAPLILTIPFSSMVDILGQENQMMMNGANFIKNILSGLTIFALFLLLKRREWRKHVLPLALMGGYLVVLVFSNFAHSERFHFPVLALELLFAAYGVTQLTNKHKRIYTLWMVMICVANILWAWVKLAGRGLT